MTKFNYPAPPPAKPEKTYTQAQFEAEMKKWEKDWNKKGTGANKITTEYSYDADAIEFNL